MKINLENMIKPTNEVDLDLLEKVDYNDMLFCVAKTLIDYRAKFNYNQLDIAKKLNMSQVMISKIESGKYNLSIKALVNIWNKLSNKDYDFAKIVLNNMMKKSQENYNIKYNLNVYTTTIKETSEEIFKLYDKEQIINTKSTYIHNYTNIDNYTNAI